MLSAFFLRGLQSRPEWDQRLQSAGRDSTETKFVKLVEAVPFAAIETIPLACQTYGSTTEIFAVLCFHN